MVLNRKLLALSGGVVAGAAALGMGAEVLLRAAVDAPAPAGVRTLPASWIIRGEVEERAAWRGGVLGHGFAPAGAERAAARRPGE